MPPMLTLGLMEGALTFVVITLVLTALVTEGAPLHKILGPPVAIVLALTTGFIAAEHASVNVRELAGILFAAFLAFIAPLAVLRAGWHALHEEPSTPVPRKAPRPAPPIAHEPEEHIRAPRAA